MTNDPDVLAAAAGAILVLLALCLAVSLLAAGLRALGWLFDRSKKLLRPVSTSFPPTPWSEPNPQAGFRLLPEAGEGFFEATTDDAEAETAGKCFVCGNPLNVGDHSGH